MWGRKWNDRRDADRPGRRWTGPAVLLVLLIALPLPAAAPAGGGNVTDGEPWLQLGHRQLFYDAVERLLLQPSLPLISARHNPKSRTSSSFYLELEGGWQAKFRVTRDPAETKRNEDLKREVACYVLSRRLFPRGGIVQPCVFRALPLEQLEQHLDGAGAKRLRRWARDGLVWGALSLRGGGTVRAETSELFGGHLTPKPSRAPGRWPPAYARQLGMMNVLALLTRNSDLHGDNWEIRETDGACFVVDNGLTFTFDGHLPPYRRWRRPCRLVAAGVGRSLVRQVTRLVADRPVVEAELANLQGSGWGLSAEECSVLFDQAQQFLYCWQSGERLDLTAEQYLDRLADGTIAPFRIGPHAAQPPVQVTDW